MAHAVKLSGGEWHEVLKTVETPSPLGNGYCCRTEYHLDNGLIVTTREIQASAVGSPAESIIRNLKGKK